MTSQALQDWCHQHGVITHGIAPAFVSEGWRGVVAQRTILPGDCLLEVPEGLLLSATGSATCDPVLGPLLLRSEHARFSTQHVLAAHLLHEVSKGSSSFWAHYIRELPTSYTCLACFSDTVVAALQLPHAQEAAAAAREQWRQGWKDTRSLLQDLGLAPKWRSWAAWRWACATISSRTMYLVGDPTGALTPLGDLHNYRAPPPPFTPELPGVTRCVKHSDRPDTAAEVAADANAAQLCNDKEQAQGQGAGDGSFDETSRCYKLYARQRYDRGDQVFLCYGRHTNLELLEIYGFILDDNPHDTALLEVDLIRLAMQQQPGSSSTVAVPRAVDCYLHADGRPSWQLLQSLRINATTAAERKAYGHLALQGQQISASGDARCARWLAVACTAQLQSLATTALEDQSLLHTAAADQGAPALDAADTEGEFMQLAMQWRLLQKTVLTKGIDVCTAWQHACES